MVVVVDFSLSRNIVCDPILAFCQMNTSSKKKFQEKVTKEVVIHVGEYSNSIHVLLICILYVLLLSKES